MGWLSRRRKRNAFSQPAPPADLTPTEYLLIESVRDQLNANGMLERIGQMPFGSAMGEPGKFLVEIHPVGTNWSLRCFTVYDSLGSLGCIHPDGTIEAE